MTFAHNFPQSIVQLLGSLKKILAASKLRFTVQEMPVIWTPNPVQKNFCILKARLQSKWSAAPSFTFNILCMESPVDITKAFTTYFSSTLTNGNPPDSEIHPMPYFHYTSRVSWNWINMPRLPTGLNLILSHRFYFTLLVHISLHYFQICYRPPCLALLSHHKEGPPLPPHTTKGS